jgi:hypothetical protein
MLPKTVVPVALVAFAAGALSGMAGERTSVFQRIESHFSAKAESQASMSSASGGKSTPATLRALLMELAKDSTFMLTALEDYKECTLVARAIAFHDDYVTVKAGKSEDRFIPYASIARVDREGPGNIMIPVVYSTMSPHLKLCGGN